MRETLASLRAAGIQTAGAGHDAAEALRPAAFPSARGRLLIFAAATEDCGALPHWQATATQPGTVLLPHAYRNRLIYGCGGFLNDDEGISGYEEYRSNLVLMYFVKLLAGAGELMSLVLVPLKMCRFRLQHAAPADAEWLRNKLDSEWRRWGDRVVSGADGTFELRCG